MLTKEFHPDQEVLLEEESNNPPPSPFSKGGERGINIRGRKELGNQVEFISESNNRIDLHVRTKENALLVLSDTYYPGWKAFIDEEKVKIYKADYNFRAIALKPGEHEIKFVYDPISFKIGMLVSLLTLVGIVVYLIKTRSSSIPKKT
jgi:uncharacterized membrane protein YfhO